MRRASGAPSLGSITHARLLADEARDEEENEEAFDTRRRTT